MSLTALNPSVLSVALTYFPASRASLKDKPCYDEVIRDLVRNRQSSSPLRQAGCRPVCQERRLRRRLHGPVRRQTRDDSVARMRARRLAFCRASLADLSRDERSFS